MRLAVAISLIAATYAQDSWDWRQQNVNTRVYEQGFKGNGGIFATIAAIEMNYQVKYPKEPKQLFSTQQIFDCFSKKTIDPETVYEYIKSNGALAFANEYPEMPDVGQQCKFHMGMEGIQITGSPGFESLISNDEENMRKVLVSEGPLTVSFAVQPDFLTYRDGIYNASSTCSLTAPINHWLVVIGYGTENGVPFWLVQNSWGSSWGQNGFGKIKRGANTCGIASSVTRPATIIDPAKEKTRPFQLMLHNIQKTGAQCLDGSPAGLYFSKGYGSGVNKTILFMMGGGQCSGRNIYDVSMDCFARSKTVLGSTSFSKDTDTWMDLPFSADPIKDQIFYNWNRVFAIYCDGTGHQGYLSKPLNIQGKDVYFKGENNTQAHFNWILKKLPPQNTDSFVFYGASAGALAVFTWIEPLQKRLKAANPDIKFMGLMDSGFFVNYKSLKTGDNDYEIRKRAVVELVNMEVPLPNTDCVKDNLLNPHYCIMAEHLVNYISAPFFMIESLYDSWQLQNILQSPCMATTSSDISKCSADEMKDINAFKAYTANKLQAVVEQRDWMRTVWAPSCVFHILPTFGTAEDPYSNMYQVPANSGKLLGNALKAFINDHISEAYIDEVNWPDNAPCSGQKTSELDY